MMEVFLSAGYFFLGIYLIGKLKFFKIPGLPNHVFSILFIIKVLSAIVLFIIYTRFYTDRANADIFRYYDDSIEIYNTLSDQPGDFFSMLTGVGGDAPHLLSRYDAMRNWYNTDLLFNDSRTMIRLSAVMRIFSLNTYFPQVVIFCFLAMTGLTGVFKVLNHHLPGKNTLLILLVYLLPSTLMWTSGLIKEAFLVFAMGIFLYQFHRVVSMGRINVNNGLCLIFMLFILVTIKAYVFFLLVPLLLSWWMFSSSRRFTFLKVALVYLIYFFALAAAAPSVTARKVPALLSAKQAEFYAVAQRDHARSVVEIPRLTDDWSSLISSSPGAFFRTLIFPLPGQAHNLLMWFSVVENLLIVGLMVFLAFTIRRGRVKDIPSFRAGVFIFSVSLFIFAGMVVPVIGALVRYKVPALPFILVPLVYWSPLNFDYAVLLNRLRLRNPLVK